MKNPYVLAFSAGAFLYVGVEAAIYVWMPTLLAGYTGSAVTLATYSISIFFLLRAAGRFLGAWMLTRVPWQTVLALFSGCILLCFALSVTGGVNWAVYLLPLSGLFMSVIYPTLNSKGISCLPKSEHGAAAGVILFFTCASAVLGTVGHRCRERRLRSHRLWLLARNRPRCATLHRPDDELGTQPDAGGARAAGCYRVQSQNILIC